MRFTGCKPRRYRSPVQPDRQPVIGTACPVGQVLPRSQPQGPRETDLMSCPICSKDTDEKYRPFCCKRCADIDLGKWFNENYSLPADDAPLPEDEAQFPEDTRARLH